MQSRDLSITINPENPTSSDVLTISIGIVVPNPWYKLSPFQQEVNDSTITISGMLIPPPPSVFCIQILGFASTSFSVGPLAQGTYSINAHVIDTGNRLLTTSSSLIVVADPKNDQVYVIESDFNKDGVVNFDDFILFAQFFGKNQEGLGFDSKFDLNNDGEINFPDFLTFAQNFGKKSK